VLHPSSLLAGDEYFEFYRSHKITHVSLSIDESEGSNLTSSFEGASSQEEVVDFIFHLLKRAFIEEYPLHIKEVERMAGILTGRPLHNEQVEAWQVVVIAADGDVSTFSPEFMEMESAAHNNFRFGNILQDDLAQLFASRGLSALQSEVMNGVSRCRAECKYFSVCGGGAPANKVQENGSANSTESLFCRMSVQSSAEALRKFVHWSRIYSNHDRKEYIDRAPFEFDRRSDEDLGRQTSLHRRMLQ
jgi:uncharacterized protein